MLEDLASKLLEFWTWHATNSRLARFLFFSVASDLAGHGSSRLPFYAMTPGVSPRDERWLKQGWRLIYLVLAMPALVELYRGRPAFSAGLGLFALGAAAAALSNVLSSKLEWRGASVVALALLVRFLASTLLHGSLAIETSFAGTLIGSAFSGKPGALEFGMRRGTDGRALEPLRSRKVKLVGVLMLSLLVLAMDLSRSRGRALILPYVGALMVVIIVVGVAGLGAWRVIAFLLVVGAVGTWAWREMKISSCLDRGGSWEYGRWRCVGDQARPTHERIRFDSLR